MAAIAFTRNYTDHSNDTGYQFEFHCDKCGNGYRSTFSASALGVGSKIAKGLGSLFGGSNLWAAGQASEYMKDGLRGKQWDEAFGKAIEEIRPKFHQCTRCGHWVCPEVCWNDARQLCEACAPDLAEEAAAQRELIAAATTVLGRVPEVERFGPAGAAALPHLLCFGVRGVEAEPILLALDQHGVAAHSGSSCSSETLEPSPVLAAMGVDADHSLRISVGWSSAMGDVERFVEVFPGIVQRLRGLRSA